MDRPLSTLSLALSTTEYGPRFLDFVVDGQPLSKWLADKGYTDNLGLLGWGSPEGSRYFAESFLLLTLPTAWNGRHAIYVCPACGHIDCGGVTVKIEEAEDNIIWRDFAYEADESGPIYPQSEALRELGPFYFESAQYRDVLNEYLRTLPG